MGTLAKNEDPNEMLHKVVFHLSAVLALKKNLQNRII